MTQLTLTRILRRSLIHRRARSLSALVALTVSAAVATALLTLYADLDNKLHKEFRSFGANVVITLPTSTGTTSPSSKPTTNSSPAEGHAFTRANNQPAAGATALPKASLSTLSSPSPYPEPQSESFQTLLAQVQQAAGPEAIAAPFAYAVATTPSNTPVVVVGVDFEAVKRLNPTWQVDRWPLATTPRTLPPPALLGQRAAQFIDDANSVTLHFNGHPIFLQGSGMLRTGGDEDSRIYIPLEAFTNWTHTDPTVIEVQIPGGAAQVEEALWRIRHQVHAVNPNVQIEPVRQLVEGESRIVDRTHALMYAAVLLIALTVGVSVLATLSASVLERRRDFALMKALGGSHLHLLSLFLLEALALALAGVAAGYLVGSVAALAISELNFHTATLPHLSVLPLALLLNLLIATAAALFPARVLRRLQPAALLKGD